MVGHNIAVKLDGILYAAFHMYCHNNGYGRSTDAVRALIRSLPEYKAILAATNGPAAQMNMDNETPLHREPLNENGEQSQSARAG